MALLRTGIVLGKGEGALAKMVRPFKFFAGGYVGSGKQWMPWIHVEDEVGLIQFLIEQENAIGAFNATAPNPVTMEEFCKALGSALNRPCWAPVPASALTLLLGEMAEMLLTGQRAVPKAAQDLGYRFRYPSYIGSASVAQALRRAQEIFRGSILNAGWAQPTDDRLMVVKRNSNIMDMGPYHSDIYRALLDGDSDAASTIVHELIAKRARCCGYLSSGFGSCHVPDRRVVVRWQGQCRSGTSRNPNNVGTNGQA